MIRRTTISSSTREQKTAFEFMMRSMNTRPCGVLYEMAVTNGRDIEMISSNSHEREVATLPGAQFKIQSLKMEKTAWGGEYLLVKCRQVK